MWRQRQWRELLLLIDWLPRDSAYMQAISDDEEFAEEMLRQEELDKKNGTRPVQHDRRPKIAEWSPDVEKLTDIVDRLGEVMQAVVAAAGGKPPKIRPQPRPRTAIDKLRDARRYEHHRKVVSRVLIQRPDGTLAPVSLGPPKKPATPTAVKRVLLAPGEDPFRLKAPPRRTQQAPDADRPVTGEPRRKTNQEGDES